MNDDGKSKSKCLQKFQSLLVVQIQKARSTKSAEELELEPEEFSTGESLNDSSSPLLYSLWLQSKANCPQHLGGLSDAACIGTDVREAESQSPQRRSLKDRDPSRSFHGDGADSGAFLPQHGERARNATGSSEIPKTFPKEEAVSTKLLSQSPRKRKARDSLPVLDDVGHTHGSPQKIFIVALAEHVGDGEMIEASGHLGSLENVLDASQALAMGELSEPENSEAFLTLGRGGDAGECLLPQQLQAPAWELLADNSQCCSLDDEEENVRADVDIIEAELHEPATIYRSSGEPESNAELDERIAGFSSGEPESNTELDERIAGFSNGKPDIHAGLDERVVVSFASGAPGVNAKQDAECFTVRHSMDTPEIYATYVDEGNVWHGTEKPRTDSCEVDPDLDSSGICPSREKKTANKSGISPSREKKPSAKSSISLSREKIPADKSSISPSREKKNKPADKSGIRPSREKKPADKSSISPLREKKKKPTDKSGSCPSREKKTADKSSINPSKEKKKKTADQSGSYPSRQKKTADKSGSYRSREKKPRDKSGICPLREKKPTCTEEGGGFAIQDNGFPSFWSNAKPTDRSNESRFTAEGSVSANPPGKSESCVTATNRTEELEDKNVTEGVLAPEAEKGREMTVMETTEDCQVTETNEDSMIPTIAEEANPSEHCRAMNMDVDGQNGNVKEGKCQAQNASEQCENTNTSEDHSMSVNEEYDYECDFIHRLLLPMRRTKCQAQLSLLEELQLAEQQKEDEVELGELQEQEELQPAEQQKEDEVQLGELQEQEELQPAEQQKEDEVQLGELKEQEELQLGEQQKQEELHLGEQQKQEEPHLAEKQKQKLQSAEQQKQEELHLVEQQKQKHQSAEQQRQELQLADQQKQEKEEEDGTQQAEKDDSTTLLPNGELAVQGPEDDNVSSNQHLVDSDSDPERFHGTPAQKIVPNPEEASCCTQPREGATRPQGDNRAAKEYFNNPEQVAEEETAAGPGEAFFDARSSEDELRDSDGLQDVHEMNARSSEDDFCAADGLQDVHEMNTRSSEDDFCAADGLQDVHEMNARSSEDDFCAADGLQDVHEMNARSETNEAAELPNRLQNPEPVSDEMLPQAHEVFFDAMSSDDEFREVDAQRASLRATTAAKASASWNVTLTNLSDEDSDDSDYEDCCGEPSREGCPGLVGRLSVTVDSMVVVVAAAAEGAAERKAVSLRRPQPVWTAADAIRLSDADDDDEWDGGPAERDARGWQMSAANCQPESAYNFSFHHVLRQSSSDTCLYLCVAEVVTREAGTDGNVAMETTADGVDGGSYASLVTETAAEAVENGADVSVFDPHDFLSSTTRSQLGCRASTMTGADFPGPFAYDSFDDFSDSETEVAFTPLHDNVQADEAASAGNSQADTSSSNSSTAAEEQPLELGLGVGGGGGDSSWGHQIGSEPFQSEEQALRCLLTFNNNSLPSLKKTRRMPGSQPCGYYRDPNDDGDYLLEYSYTRRRNSSSAAAAAAPEAPPYRGRTAQVSAGARSFLYDGSAGSCPRAARADRQRRPAGHSGSMTTVARVRTVGDHPQDCKCLQYDCLRRRGEMLHDHVMKNLNVLRKFASDRPRQQRSNFTIKIKEAVGSKAKDLIEKQKSSLNTPGAQRPPQAARPFARSFCTPPQTSATRHRTLSSSLPRSRDELLSPPRRPNKARSGREGSCPLPAPASKHGAAATPPRTKCLLHGRGLPMGISEAWRSRSCSSNSRTSLASTGATRGPSASRTEEAATRDPSSGSRYYDDIITAVKTCPRDPSLDRSDRLVTDALDRLCALRRSDEECDRLLQRVKGDTKADTNENVPSSARRRGARGCCSPRPASQVRAVAGLPDRPPPASYFLSVEVPKPAPKPSKAARKSALMIRFDPRREAHPHARALSSETKQIVTKCGHNTVTQEMERRQYHPASNRTASYFYSLWREPGTVVNEVDRGSLGHDSDARFYDDVGAPRAYDVDDVAGDGRIDDVGGLPAVDVGGSHVHVDGGPHVEADGARQVDDVDARPVKDADGPQSDDVGSARVRPVGSTRPNGVGAPRGHGYDAPQVDDVGTPQVGDVGSTRSGAEVPGCDVISVPSTGAKSEATANAYGPDTTALFFSSQTQTSPSNNVAVSVQTSPRLDMGNNAAVATRPDQDSEEAAAAVATAGGAGMYECAYTTGSSFKTSSAASQTPSEERDGRNRPARPNSGTAVTSGDSMRGNASGSAAVPCGSGSRSGSGSGSGPRKQSAEGIDSLPVVLVSETREATRAGDSSMVSLSRDCSASCLKTSQDNVCACAEGTSAPCTPKSSQTRTRRAQAPCATGAVTRATSPAPSVASRLSGGFCHTSAYGRCGEARSVDPVGTRSSLSSQAGLACGSSPNTRSRHSPLSSRDDMYRSSSLLSPGSRSRSSHLSGPRARPSHRSPTTSRCAVRKRSSRGTSPDAEPRRSPYRSPRARRSGNWTPPRTPCNSMSFSENVPFYDQTTTRTTSPMTLMRLTGSPNPSVIGSVSPRGSSARFPSSRAQSGEFLTEGTTLSASSGSRARAAHPGRARRRKSPVMSPLPRAASYSSPERFRTPPSASRQLTRSTVSQRTSSSRGFRRTSPSREFRRRSPSREFRRPSPSREFRRTSPSREFRRTSPSREFQRTSPSREFQRTSPSQESQRTSPSREFQRSPSQESQRTSPLREFQRSPSQESQRTSPSREFQRTSSSQEFQASFQSSPRRRQSSGSRRSKRSKSPRRRKCLVYSTTSANDSAPGTCTCTGSSTGVLIFSSGGELSSAVPGATASQVSVSSSISVSLSTSGVIVPFQGRRLPACSSPLTSPLLTPMSRLKENVFPPKLNPCLSEPAPAGRRKVSPVSSGSVGLLKSASSRLFRPLVAVKDYLFHSGSESQATGPNSTCSPTSCPCADLSSDASAARLASSGRVSSRTRAAVSSKRSPSASPKASRSRSLQRQATLSATEASASRTYLAATASRTSSRQLSPHGSSHHSSWVRDTSATSTTAAYASTSATSACKVSRTSVRQASSGSSHHSVSAEGSATNRSQVCSCKSSAVNVKRSRTHARHASSGSSFHARSSSHREMSRVVSGLPSRQGSAWSPYHTKCVPEQPFPSKTSSSSKASRAPSRQPSPVLSTRSSSSLCKTTSRASHPQLPCWVNAWGEALVGVAVVVKALARLTEPYSRALTRFAFLVALVMLVAGGYLCCYHCCLTALTLRSSVIFERLIEDVMGHLNLRHVMLPPL